MRKLEAKDIKDIGLLKHYRIVRKWACKNNKLNDADLELLKHIFGSGYGQVPCRNNTDAGHMQKQCENVIKYEWVDRELLECHWLAVFHCDVLFAVKMNNYLIYVDIHELLLVCFYSWI